MYNIVDSKEIIINNDRNEHTEVFRANIVHSAKCSLLNSFMYSRKLHDLCIHTCNTYISKWNKHNKV